jgi:DNA-binding transcriptional ArsR family regulator
MSRRSALAVRKADAAPRESEAAPIFAALGDETRLALVRRLGADGPLSITRLTEGASITRQAVTKHLTVLAEAGLVHGSRQGRESLWELRSGPFDIARRFLDLTSRRWDERIERLRELVEE